MMGRESKYENVVSVIGEPDWVEVPGRMIQPRVRFIFIQQIKRSKMK